MSLRKSDTVSTRNGNSLRENTDLSFITAADYLSRKLLPSISLKYLINNMILVPIRGVQEKDKDATFKFSQPNNSSSNGTLWVFVI